jgi:hypothetical protein
LWKQLQPTRRLPIATAFWQDTQSTDIAVQHVEAMAALARRLNFRMKSVRALPAETRARYLAQMSDVSDMVAMRALVAYHMANARPLMAGFLDALGIAHDNGVITADQVPAPDAATLKKAVEAIRASYPADEVELYLRTLVAVDEDTWSGLAPLLA